MNTNGKDMLCELPAVERPRYFPRQLITPEDMTMEQDYFRNRMRLHNRLLHGWGVVCGALVTPVIGSNGNGEVTPWKVKVCPGYALGPYGDEIAIACEHEVDVRTESVTGSAVDPCGMGRDPWCSEVWIDRDPTERLYIAVKYKEIAVRPMRVQPVGCGCDDSRCEYSRFRDGYEIKALTETEYQQIRAAMQPSPSWLDLFRRTGQNPAGDRNPACWPCSPHPWVVLACLELDESGRPTLIDNCGPRRMVGALGGFHWQCAGGVEISAVTAEPSLTPGAEEVLLDFAGNGFQEGLIVVPGKDLSVVSDSFDPIALPTRFTVSVNVSGDALPGPRDVLVINPDCSFGRGALEIFPAGGTGAGLQGSARVGSVSDQGAPKKKTAKKKTTPKKS